MKKQIETQYEDNVAPNIPYIPETEDMVSLRKYASSEMMSAGKQLGQINMAFDLLKHVLFRMYKSTSFSTLITRSTLISESDIFSKHTREIVRDMKWANKTNLAIFSILKGILKCTSIDPFFINRISVVFPTVYPISHPFHILPSAYKHLDTNSPERILMLKWIDIIKETTKNKSPISIKNMLYFFTSLLPVFGLEDLSKWDDDISRTAVEERLDAECITNICDTNNKKKLWLKIFCLHIVKANISDQTLFSRAARRTIDAESVFSETRDTHRISVAELETLYGEAKKNLRDELIFLMLLTTGMRVGGLVNIRLEHVADVNDKGVEVKTCGRTLEKGNKWFTFVMNDRVRELVKEWIIKERHTTSPYLFSSKCGSMPYVSRCTIRAIFKRLCDRVGLSGSHLHPHALRHTYAHMLLESGNSIDIISKLIGHSNSLTTESFYLKESAVEVANRANIPWLSKAKPEKKIPDFLMNQRDDKRGVTENERKRRLKNLATISNFEIKEK